MCTIEAQDRCLRLSSLPPLNAKRSIKRLLEKLTIKVAYHR